MKKEIFFIFAITYLNLCCKGEKYTTVPILNAHPCENSKEITVNYDPVYLPEANEYSLFINKTFTAKSKVTLKFDTDCYVVLENTNISRILGTDGKTFVIQFYKGTDGLKFTVKAKLAEKVAYITNLAINSKEYCSQPSVGFLDDVFLRYQESADRVSREPKKCRRRIVGNSVLDATGASTKPGDWPWHAAIYKHDETEIKYTCGGTLVSKEFVLTAAQCTSIKGVPLVPEALSVFFGKFNLIGGDKNTQERQVHKIINHEKFDYQHLNNDIALMRLKSDVTFSDFVQPACLWYNNAAGRLPTGPLVGTIVGWGFDDTASFSPHLQQVKMPMVSEGTCLKSHPNLYSTIMNKNKFCAGYSNGSTACNVDAGSSFQIFIPDQSKDTSPNTIGSWYVRGIVSLIATRPDAPICGSEHYIIFTDVEKYTIWIDLHMKSQEI